MVYIVPVHCSGGRRGGYNSWRLRKGESIDQEVQCSNTEYKELLLISGGIPLATH